MAEGSVTADMFEHVVCWVCPSPHLERDCEICHGRVVVVVWKCDVLAIQLRVLEDLDRLKRSTGLLYLSETVQTLRARYEEESRVLKEKFG